MKLIERVLPLRRVRHGTIILADPAPVQRLNGIRYLAVVNPKLV